MITRISIKTKYKDEDKSNMYTFIFIFILNLKNIYFFIKIIQICGQTLERVDLISYYQTLLTVIKFINLLSSKKKEDKSRYEIALIMYVYSYKKYI